MNREELEQKFIDVINITGCFEITCIEAKQCADICEAYAKDKIEETAKNGIVELMEAIPQKMAAWMVLVFGRECVKCNAGMLELSEEADIEGKRYKIKTVITIEKI